MQIKCIDKILERKNGKSKPLALTKSFTKKCRNLKIRYGRGNVRSRKCLSGEMSSWGSVWWWNCPFGEMSIGEVSVWELSSWGTVLQLKNIGVDHGHKWLCHFDRKTLKLAVSHEEINGINWFLVC